MLVKKKGREDGTPPCCSLLIFNGRFHKKGKPLVGHNWKRVLVVLRTKRRNQRDQKGRKVGKEVKQKGGVCSPLSEQTKGFFEKGPSQAIWLTRKERGGLGGKKERLL